MSWHDEIAKFNITKTILATSNIKDGGYIILAVELEDNKFTWVGMEEEHARSYNFDLVSSQVAPYADPHLIKNVCSD
jgi:hypothetical protein